MHNKYRFWIIIEAVVILCLTSLNFYHKYQEMVFKQEIEDLQNTRNLYQMLLANFRLQTQSEDIKLSPNIILEDLDGSETSLKDLTDSGTKVIYRFSPFHCQNCIDHGVNYLIKLGLKIGYKNIVILTSFKEKRELYVFKELIKSYDFEILNINPKNLNLPIDHYSLPYIFIADKHFLVKNVFIPSKELPDRTERYFKIIIEKYFSLSSATNY